MGTSVAGTTASATPVVRTTEVRTTEVRTTEVRTTTMATSPRGRAAKVVIGGCLRSEESPLAVAGTGSSAPPRHFDFTRNTHPRKGAGCAGEARHMTRNLAFCLPGAA